MKIYVNGNFLRQPKTGVQRYGHELLHQFDQLLASEPAFSSHQIEVLSPPIPGFTPPWRKLTYAAFGSGHHHIWEQIELPLYVRGAPLFSPSNLGPMFYTNQIITLHDASIYAVPNAYTFGFKTKYKVVLHFLSRLALVLVTDSEFSKNEINAWLGVKDSKIRVIHLGGDHLRNVQTDYANWETLGLKKGQYFLLVGSRSQHKNTTLVYQVLESIGYSGKLVHIGGSFSRVFNSQPQHTPTFEVIDPGYVSDGLLRALYANAKALIFPSLYEGFGFPPLEAMAEGCPVICSNAASLPEIIGSATLTFDPRNQAELADQIRLLLASPVLADQLSQRGMENSAQFTWEKTARQTLEHLISRFQA